MVHYVSFFKTYNMFNMKCNKRIYVPKNHDPKIETKCANLEILNLLLENGADASLQDHSYIRRFVCLWYNLLRMKSPHVTCWGWARCGNGFIE